jgi:hypothetical protein
MMIVHNLEITFHQSGQYKELFVAMDDADMAAFEKGIRQSRIRELFGIARIFAVASLKRSKGLGKFAIRSHSFSDVFINYPQYSYLLSLLYWSPFLVSPASVDNSVCKREGHW